MQSLLRHPIIHHAHYYDDEDGWEMPKVYTETYMESNWSETEMFKIKEGKFQYGKTEISDKEWKIKIYWDVMLCHWTSSSWCCKGL